jgi:crotonobetainyl-CoA:carnitine CoA-transferase CaiB-like acyl-CoA transferase
MPEPSGQRAKPLSGIRVLDLTRLLPGPVCSLHLADMGADVIKVEDPGAGDYARAMRGYFSPINRNKRSLTLDLKQPRGRELFLELVRDAQVVMEGFRPGVMRRLGVDYERVAEVNPGIVYCSITGYGQSGPYRDRAGHDLNYCAYAGIVDQVGARDGPPVIPNFQIADILVLSGGLPWYAVYETADRRYLALGALEFKFWQALGAAMELPDWARTQPEGEAERERIRAELVRRFKTRSRDDWLRHFAGVDCCLAPVLTIAEARQDAHFRARGMFAEVEGEAGSQFAFPVRLTDFEFEVARAAPEQGQHNNQVLQELGYSAAQIAALREEGVV